LLINCPMTVDYHHVYIPITLSVAVKHIVPKRRANVCSKGTDKQWKCNAEPAPRSTTLCPHPPGASSQGNPKDYSSENSKGDHIQC